MLEGKGAKFKGCAVTVPLTVVEGELRILEVLRGELEGNSEELLAACCNCWSVDKTAATLLGEFTPGAVAIAIGELVN